MDHLRIIKRAFEITIRYRVLWIFGILLALTTSHGGGGGGGGGGNGRVSPGTTPFPQNVPGLPNFNPAPVIGSIIGVVIALACVILVLVIVFAILRYVATTASIRMVNRYEDSGEQVSWREGFRLGWNRSAFSLWLVDLLFGLAGFVIFIILFALAAAPLLLLLAHNEAMTVISIVLTIGLVLLVILLAVVVSSLVSLWLHIAYRAIVLEGLGVFDGLRRSWQMVRARPWDVILMGLILFGIGLAFGIVMIPVILALLLVGAGVGGLPALLGYFITNLFAQGQALPIIVAIIIGLPLFLLVIVLPSLFINGLYEVFTSSTWTLTYRELLALAAVGPAAPVVPVTPVDERPVPPEEPLPPSEPLPEA